MLEKQIELLTIFRNKSWDNKSHTKEENLFLVEALGRLIKLNLLLDRYEHIKNNNQTLEVLDYLILDAENFYYQAWRIINCLKKLPELSNRLQNKFPEIRNIRNLLIEHSGEQTEVLSLSYSIDSDGNNLQIKPQTASHQYHIDQGFENNVDSFKQKLEDVINEAM